MAICEFATIDSDKEVVVHGANLANAEDFEWLAETLGIYPSDELLAALWLPNNESFLLVLYAQMHQKYQGEVPGEILELDENTIPPTVMRRAPDWLMSEDGLTDPHLARWTLFALHERAENVGNWRIPRCDIWLPMTPTILSHLQHLVARGPSKGRCIEVQPPEFPSDTVSKLVELIVALERQVERLEAERSNWAIRRLSLEHARRIVALSVWQWTNAAPEQPKKAEMLERLADVMDAMEELDRAADDASPMLAAEREAANQLLDLLAPESNAAKDIEQALEILAAQPNAFRSSQAEDLFNFLKRAFAALSASTAAEEFVTTHVVSLVQAMAEGISPELEREFADGYGDLWKTLWTVDWREALVVLQENAVGSNPSPYAKLATMGKYYKEGLFVIQQAVNVSTFRILLRRLSDHAKSEAVVKSLLDSLTVCLLRGVLAGGAIHRGAPGVVLFGGRDITKWFKACARALGRAPIGAAMSDVAREMKALNLEDALKRTRFFSSLSFLVSAISTMTAYDEAWDDTWQNWMKMYSAAIKTTEDLANLTGVLARQGVMGMDKGGAKAFAMIGERLGMMAAAVSLVVAGGDTLQNWAYMSPRKKLAGAIATLSATAALMSLVPFVAASARWTSLVGPAGVVLAIAEFGLETWIAMTSSDTQQLLLKYVEFALVEGPYRQNGAAEECQTLTTEVVRAKSASAFVRLGSRVLDLRRCKGARDQIPEYGAPTWFLAYSMGFSAEIIAKLFECDLLDVVGAGIPLGPGYQEALSAPTRPTGVDDAAM
jgi:hypothetical protein